MDVNRNGMHATIFVSGCMLCVYAIIGMLYTLRLVSHTLVLQRRRTCWAATAAARSLAAALAWIETLQVNSKCSPPSVRELACLRGIDG